MSVYGKREGAAYTQARPVPNEWAENEHILAWWTPDHDQAVLRTIEEWQWNWYWRASDEIVAVTPNETLETWRKQDRLCRKYAWYNILMNFAQARAQVLGFTAKIRSPERRSCALCGLSFTEDSLPMPVVERLGVSRLDVCAPCVEATILSPGSDSVTREEILEYVTRLTTLAGRVPPQGFGERKPDLFDVDTDTRVHIMELMKKKPAQSAVKLLFGSWFDALVAAGVLEDGARRTARGVQCRAKDGHMCYSLGEKTIDDMLLAMGLEHEREPTYPDSDYRADFRVGDCLVEYFGLAGNPEYDAKTKSKLALAKRKRIRLVAVYPTDLASRKKLERKLSTLSD